MRSKLIYIGLRLTEYIPFVCSEFAGFTVTTVFLVLMNCSNAGKLKNKPIRMNIEPVIFDVAV
jgi:hypothetical protein